MATLAKSFMADFDDDEDDVALPPLQTATGAKPPASAASAAASAAAASSAGSKVKSEPGPAVDAAAVESKDGMQDEEGEEDGEDDGEDDEDEDVAVNELDFDADQQQPQDGAQGPQPVTDDPLAPTFDNATPIAAISALLHSDKLQTHMAVISHFQFGTPLPAAGTAAAAAEALAASPSPAVAAAAASAPINKEREYPYIVASNELSFEIDSHIGALHKFARDLYAPRYGELEQLLSNPIEYARVAQLIGNETDMARVTKLLQDVKSIASNVLLTISVTATTTRGKPLPPAELSKLQAVCDTILQLDQCKTRMHAYIASRMHALAPNVSAMLGTDVAARLVQLAGGIKKLSEMPACNLQNLGKKGKNASGLSRVSQGVHDGLISTSAVIQDTPPALRQRALRLLGGKVTLAARLDAFGAEDAPLGGVSSTAMDGARGRELLADVRGKIEKWQEAPAAAPVKALPAPLSRAKPRRGGRRHRKQREASAITDLGRQKKRAFFGKEELVDEYTGEGLGMIGQEGTGQLRVQVKEQKLAKRLSQKTQARLKKQAGVLGVGNKAALAGLGTVTSLASISGTASSIAFTPAQGMQLVKTESAATRGDALKKASDTYFTNNLAFSRVKQEAQQKKQLPPVPTFAAAAASDSAPPGAKRQKIA